MKSAYLVAAAQSAPGTSRRERRALIRHALQPYLTTHKTTTARTDATFNLILSEPWESTKTYGCIIRGSGRGQPTIPCSGSWSQSRLIADCGSELRVVFSGLAMKLVATWADNIVAPILAIKVLGLRMPLNR